MAHRAKGDGACQVCGRQKPAEEMLPGALVRNSVKELIKEEYPDWSDQGSICLEDLNHFRTRYVQGVLEKEKGELNQLDLDVMKSLEEKDTLSRDIYSEFDKKLTIGARIADRVAEFGGSWTFILLFGGIIGVWIAINTAVLFSNHFDPYPYILLNLALSCLAAIQAPIIMMSQNRQEERDRLRSENDYRINLKAELEIRHLNEKVDYLLKHQWEHLLEIQQIQLELVEELARKASGNYQA